MSGSKIHQGTSSAIEEALKLTPEETRTARESLAGATRARPPLDVRVTERPKQLDARQLIDWTTVRF